MWLIDSLSISFFVLNLKNPHVIMDELRLKGTMMIIQHAILHILDTNTGSLIASQGERALDGAGVQDYIEQIVKKIYAGDVKKGTLTAHDYLATMLDNADFSDMTTQLASKMFDIMSGQDAIRPGDILSFLATTDDGPLFGLIKLNFSPRYAHVVAYQDNQMINNLVLNQAVLPAATQTVDEAILVDLTTQQYHLLEKKYLIDGHRVAYFSEKFLAIQPETSVKENMQTIKRTVKNIADKYDDLPAHEVLAKTQEVIYDALESGQLDTNTIAEKVFSDNLTAKMQYQEKIAAQVIDKTIAIENKEKYQKKYRTQKFKLDSGIEISIPISVYQDPSKVEFVNNVNGTMSLVIKDIESVFNKFTV